MDKSLNDLFTLIAIYNPEGKPMSVDAIKAIAKDIPIQPIRRGEWLATGRIEQITGALEYECSYCHIQTKYETIYCPECGAKNIN